MLAAFMNKSRRSNAVKAQPHAVDTAKGDRRASIPVPLLENIGTPSSLAGLLPIDCAICMGPIQQAGCGKCMHHFCYECLLKAAQVARAENRKFECPMCRVGLDFIQEDRDFDRMVKAVTMAIEAKQAKEEAAALETELQPALQSMRIAA